MSDMTSPSKGRKWGEGGCPTSRAQPASKKKKDLQIGLQSRKTTEGNKNPKRQGVDSQREAVVKAALGPSLQAAGARSVALGLAMDECNKEGNRALQLRKAVPCNSCWREKESVESYLRCLDEIHKKHGMTELFILLFEELYEMEIEEGTLPQEKGDWQEVRVAQVLRNLQQACRNGDQAHFCWFMYMMKRFTLEEKTKHD